MAKLCKVALWTGGVTVLVLVLLWATCAVGTVYRWMVRYIQPAVWEAIR